MLSARIYRTIFVTIKILNSIATRKTKSLISMWKKYAILYPILQLHCDDNAMQL